MKFDQNMFAAVNHQDGKTVVAFKGTPTWRDVLPHSFNSAKVFTHSVQALYPDNKIILTGHSLGGTIATQLALTNKNLKCEAFNPCISPIDGTKNLLK